VSTFEWDFGDGTQSFEPVPTHAYTAEGTYVVQLRVLNVCLKTQETYQQELLISPKPVVLAGNDTSLCALQPLPLSASTVQNAQYTWTGPDGFSANEQFPLVPEMTPATSGAFQVIATLQGCDSEPAQTQVNVLPLPQPNLGGDTVICEGQSFQRNPGSFPAYIWQDGSANSSQTFSTPGTYWVEVADTLGCINRDSLVLNEGCPVYLFVPSAFSPNGDGINDRFQVIGDEFESFRMEIFDQWGRVVFEASNPRASWDGSTGSTPAPEGVYTWRIAFAGLSEAGQLFSQQRLGTLTLLR